MGLLEETKLEMGYSESQRGFCKTCIYCSEEENPHLDRDWILECTYSNLCKFQVKEYGYCFKYLKVKNEKK